MVGRQYTWSNNHLDTTFEKLDRFLVSSEWDLAYQNAMVVGLNRSFSDHSPCVLILAVVCLAITILGMNCVGTPEPTSVGLCLTAGVFRLGVGAVSTCRKKK